MRNKGILRLMAALMAVVLCAAAFSVTAFAYGGDTAVAETTGGLKLDTEENEPDDEAEAGMDTAALTGEDIAELLSSLFGSQVGITVTDDGIQIAADTEETETTQTGIVTTNGGNLNVRTGAGLDNTAFTQLPNGTTVEVIGKDGDWIKILLPERVGYVYSDYLTVSDAETEATGGGSFSLSFNEEELAALLELFTGSLETGGSAALTPDGNLTLIDDIGSTTAAGKQFITVETKNGNVFYLIIDRDDKGEETVHFLNQVDEADLLALMEDGETAAANTAIVCTCTDKCVPGAVDTSCPVCKNNMSECTGKEAVADTEPEPDVPEESVDEKKSGAGALLAVLLILAAGGGAAAYFLVMKPKKGKKVPSDLDDFDLEDEEEYLSEDEGTN
ncbi:MAG: bacteriocin [Clostridia bacterium]|nr:MAG: bacteriocin [Clostridia bacterium]